MSPVESPYDGGSGHSQGLTFENESLPDGDGVSARRRLDEGWLTAAYLVGGVATVHFSVTVE